MKQLLVIVVVLTSALFANTESKDGDKGEKIDENKIHEISSLNQKPIVENDTVSINCKYDDMEEITWCSVEYADSPIQLYFGKYDTGKLILRLKIEFKSNKWLFVKSYKIKVSGVIYNYDPEVINRDNSNCVIWEWSDEAIHKKNSELVRALLKADNAKIRYVGQKYYDDKILYYGNFEEIRKIYEKYKSMGGAW